MEIKEVATIFTRKLTIEDNNGVVTTAITTTSDESNFKVMHKRSLTTRLAVSMNEEDYVLNAKKRSKLSRQ
ncbi:hypothetical protein K2173_010418 [Erythroxylum novogranatense]|uniref:Uncharacterized protein n=1 Tax=Erythroxylum novogranatense TaxID=1862640 RepID=A0AAV8TE18_9ROSI|nr:hypothetical protein K2173_010418 [Erythroxylum novogranatense]